MHGNLHPTPSVSEDVGIINNPGFPYKPLFEDTTHRDSLGLDERRGASISGTFREVNRAAVESSSTSEKRAVVGILPKALHDLEHLLPGLNAFSVLSLGSRSFSILTTLFSKIVSPVFAISEGYNFLVTAVDEAVEMATQQKPEYCFLPDLASRELGSAPVFVTDEFFADAACMLEPTDPIFDPEKFTEEGKWMDGWESRRRRGPFHDWCIVKLGVPGVIKGFDIETTFFTGNHAPRVSIEGACITGDFEEGIASAVRQASSYGTGFRCRSAEEIKLAKEVVDKHNFFTLLKETPMQPGYPEIGHNYAACEAPTKVVTHLKINQHPDGGISRFRAYGEVKKRQDTLVGDNIDVASCLNGGIALCWSDAHFGSPANLLLPGRAPNMKNGWETARSLKRPAVLLADQDGFVSNFENSEWAIIKLGARAKVWAIELDTNHFKGNYPETVEILAYDDVGTFEEPVMQQRAHFTKKKDELSWVSLLPKTKSAPHVIVRYATTEGASKFGVKEPTLKDVGSVTHLLISIAPDGGLSRVRVFGTAVA